jgi:hypothetical protein
MDKSQKKAIQARVRREQRKAALAALPLPVGELRAMFDMLDAELARQACDHTHRLTKAWLVDRGHDAAAVVAWLASNGGYCDCEVVANVEEYVDDAAKGEK